MIPSSFSRVYLIFRMRQVKRMKNIFRVLFLKDIKIDNSAIKNRIVTIISKVKTGIILGFKTSPFTLYNRDIQELIKKYATVEQNEKQRAIKSNNINIEKTEINHPNSILIRNNDTYYFEKNLRKVHPYYFTYTRFTKKSWVGMKAIEVFKREFRAHPDENYETYIKSGILTVNNQRIDIDYRLKNNDLLGKFVYRHEKAVINQPITFIHVDHNIVVINKPASIPVYPCGRYRLNTILFILEKEFNLPNLKTIHRLDKLTSGLLLLGRTSNAAKKFSYEFHNRLVEKEYICVVKGEFPKVEVECQEPIKLLKYKIVISKISPDGKKSSTIFKRLSYNVVTNTSIVLCKPKTGRQHQIRVHLQYLGYPIVNDPLYNHPAFGPLCGKGGDAGGKSDEELVKDLYEAKYCLEFSPIGSLIKNKYSSFNNQDKWDSRESIQVIPRRFSKPTAISVTNNILPTMKSDILRDIRHSELGYEFTMEVNSNSSSAYSGISNIVQPQKIISPSCSSYECNVQHCEPDLQDLVLYLHAWKYRGPGWEYKTRLPLWAY